MTNAVILSREPGNDPPRAAGTVHPGPPRNLAQRPAGPLVTPIGYARHRQESRMSAAPDTADILLHPDWVVPVLPQGVVLPHVLVHEARLSQREGGVP